MKYCTQFAHATLLCAQNFWPNPTEHVAKTYLNNWHHKSYTASAAQYSSAHALLASLQVNE